MAISPNLMERLDEVVHRHQELEALLGDQDVIADLDRFVQLSREYSGLQPIVTAFEKFRSIDKELAEALELLDEEDKEIRDIGNEFVDTLYPMFQKALQEVELLLLPTDPSDKANVFLEIRAGTGGEEAALFVGDLAQMYEKYAAQQGWNAQLISKRVASQGGMKEAVFRISGTDVYSKLKFESGTHRVQRVPQTESQGRIHTSACTVAILPEIEELTDVEIKDSDLRIDTYRASGAGGQHVNKKDTAVRITHLPTGTVAECQDERSQHQNKLRAMALLKSRILDAQREEQEQERTLDRKTQVGSGDRSERVRTYNFPQGRLTDHRVQLTLYKLDEIMEGALDQVIDPLIKDHQVSLLREIDGDFEKSIDA